MNQLRKIKMGIFATIGTGFFILLFQNASPPPSKYDQYKPMTSNKAVCTNGKQLCDPKMTRNLVFQHPNSTFNTKNLPPSGQSGDLYAFGQRLKESLASNPTWVVSNWWASYPLIENSSLAWNSTNTDYARWMNSVHFADANALNQNSGFVATSIKKTLAGSSINPMDYSAEINQIDGLATVSLQLVFNSSSTLKPYIGDTYLRLDTFKEVIKDFTTTQIDNLVNQTKGGSLEDMYNRGDIAGLKKALQPLLTRNEQGFKELDGSACSESEKTYIEGPSYYCKWNHLALTQSFNPPLKITNTINGKISIRVIEHTENKINKYLYKAGLSKDYTHMNWNIFLRRPRVNSAVAPYDSISVAIPIMEANEMCYRENNLPASSKSPYCNRTVPFLSGSSTAGHEGESEFSNLPDFSTGWYMFKVGRRNIAYGSPPVNYPNLSDVIKKIQWLAAGNWTTISYNSENLFPSDFEQQFLAAIDRCIQNTQKKLATETDPNVIGQLQTQLARCQVESTNWKEYSITSTAISYETLGVWQSNVLIQNFQLSTE